METQVCIRRGLLALGCALIVVLAGCGVTARGGDGLSPTAASPATPTAAASASAATHTATTSGPTGGAVTLSLGAQSYATTDRIVITIRNGGGATLYVQQHNTSCSMISLQRLVNGVWQPVFPCVNSFPHPTVSRVAADSSVAVPLVPVVTGDAEGTGGVTWPAGTYRATLLYTTSQTASFGQGTTVYSGTFTVA